MVELRRQLPDKHAPLKVCRVPTSPSLVSKMRLFSFFNFVLLAFLGAASTKSAVGDRVLIVLEDESQKGLYSKFWADLEGTATYIVFGFVLA